MSTGAFIFEWIYIILAGNKYNHKSLHEFEFLPDPITNYLVRATELAALERWKNEF